MKANPKGPTQEGNVTLDFGEGNKVNVRVETHEITRGEGPVRHANVETVKTTRGKSRVVENKHILEESE